MMLEFKVHPCNRTDIHDQLRCLGVHPGEEMTRRDPCRCQYTGIACPSMRHGGGCDLGQACPFAHNPLEYWLHPSRFRTQLCPDAFACRRAVCFLAHNPEELRLPSEPSLPAGALLHAAAAVAAGTAGAAPPPVPLGLSVAARQRPERAGPAAGSACLPERDARLSADAPSPEEYRRALQQTAALLRRGQQGGAAPAQQKQEGHAPFWLQQPCAAPPLPVEAVCCGDPASHRHGHRRPPPHRTGPQSDVPACASRAAPAKAAAQRGAACATAAAAGQGPEPALLHVCADQAERQLIQPSARMAGTAAARLFAVPEGFASVLAWHCRSSTDTDCDDLDFASWRCSGASSAAASVDCSH